MNWVNHVLSDLFSFYGRDGAFSREDEVPQASHEHSCRAGVYVRHAHRQMSLQSADRHTQTFCMLSGAATWLLIAWWALQVDFLGTLAYVLVGSFSVSSQSRSSALAGRREAIQAAGLLSLVVANERTVKEGQNCARGYSNTF